MAGRTVQNIRRAVSQMVSRRYFVGTSTSVGSGTLTDTSTDGPRMYPDDEFNNSWLWDNGDVNFLVTNYVQSTGVFTLQPTATPTAGAYEVHSFNNATFVDALVLAERDLYHEVGLGRRLVDQGMVSNSPLYNGGFEEWSSSSAAVGWTVTSSTLAEEIGGEKAMPGSRYSAHLSSAAGNLETTSTYDGELLVLRDHTVDLYFWAWADTGSSARIAVNEGGTLSYSSYHAGNSRWELLSVEGDAIASDAQYVRIRLLMDTSNNAYFDNGWIEGGPSLWVVRCPDHFEFGPDRIHASAMYTRSRLDPTPEATIGQWSFTRGDDRAATSDYAYLHFDPPLVGYQRLRLEANVPLAESTSSDTAVVELGDIEARLLEARTALYVLERIIQRLPVGFQSDYRQRQAIVAGQEGALRRRLQHSTAVTLGFDI